MYLITAPWLLKKIYRQCVWDKPGKSKCVYLTFDDGPHELATPFVLDQLKQYDAKATFFCVGNNVVSLPGIFQRIKDEGHVTGNHTYDHVNGWKVEDEVYISNAVKANEVIRTKLFRPPYGRIKHSQ